MTPQVHFLEDVPIMEPSLGCGKLAALRSGAAQFEAVRRNVEPQLRALVPEHLQEQYRIVPLQLDGNILRLGMENPHDKVAIDGVRLITGHEILAVDLKTAEHTGAEFTPEGFTLSSLEVRARLTGPLAEVQVRQAFHNPSAETLEAVYIFPLSGRAAVHGFRMTVGDRVIQGEIQEQLQARETYREGLRDGMRCALLEQERPNVFSTRVGNIPPGAEVCIELSYCERLETDECSTTFRFPLVVAPRYCPSSCKDAERISPPLLPPGLRAPSALTIAVELEHGDFPLQRLECSQHAMAISAAAGTTNVQLCRQNEALNRDFVLRFATCQPTVAAQLLTSGDHFLLWVTPPDNPPRERPAREIIFLLDCSGSMEGAKIESARRAVLAFLDTLTVQDRFALVSFSHVMQLMDNGAWLGVDQLPAAREWVQTHSVAAGGTEILGPIEWVLGLPASGEHRCVVLITDGEVGNESQIYQAIQTSGTATRFFTLGIDSAVNDAFLRQVARLGRGTCELVTPGEALQTALARLSREVGHPLVTNLELVDQGLGCETQTLVPARLPDLYAARPVVVLGRCSGNGAVEVRGECDGQPWAVQAHPKTSLNPAIGTLWARERLQDMEDQLALGSHHERLDLKSEMIALALHHGLLSKHTSFVLVDRSAPVGTSQRTVSTSVELPAEWTPSPARSVLDHTLSSVYCTVKDISAMDFGPLDFDEELAVELDATALLEHIEEAPIVRLCELILSQAINDQASHIHIQPEAKSVSVFYRVRGNLEQVMTPPKHVQSALLGRLKVMAGLHSGQTATPLLGRFSFTHGNRECAVSLSAYPGEYGDRLVIHLQPSAVSPVPLNELGFAPQLLQQMVQLLSLKKGLLLITGSSDSVRWLTLASLLHHSGADPRRHVAVWDPNWRPAVTGLQHLRPLGTVPRAEWLQSLKHQDLDMVGVSGLETAQEWEALLGLVDKDTLVLATWAGSDIERPRWECSKGYLGVLNVSQVPTLCQCEVWKVGVGSCTSCYNTGVRGTQLVAELLQPG